MDAAEDRSNDPLAFNGLQNAIDVLLMGSFSEKTIIKITTTTITIMIIKIKLKKKN